MQKQPKQIPSAATDELDQRGGAAPLAKAQEEKWQMPVLPSGWELVDSLSETLELEGLTLQMAGFGAQSISSNLMATGSSAGYGVQPERFAYYELLERIAIVQALSQPQDKLWSHFDSEGQRLLGQISGAALFPLSPSPDLWQYAKSNGVAIGQTFQKAAMHALSEAIERHLVLSSWYGVGRANCFSRIWPEGLEALGKRYRIENYQFGEVSLFGMKGKIVACGTFLWPLNKEDPLIYGFGAGAHREEACAKSSREAIQRLCFLDGSGPVEAEPSFCPRPDFHQEYFLHRDRYELLEKWLRGEWSRLEPLASPLALKECLFVDITPAHFEGLRVVRVHAPALLPLVFGHYIPQQFSDCSLSRLVHPIV